MKQWFNKTLEALHLKERAIETRAAAKAAVQELKAAVTEVQQSPTPAAVVAEPSPSPTAAKPAAAIDPKPAPVASKPAPPATTAASFGKRPDFSNLKGIDRAAASMKWDADRKAHFLAEAEKIIAAEEAAAKGDPTAGKPVTAQSIASEILRQQAEAEKPKSSAWSREAGERRERVKKLAAELAAKDPQ